MIGKHVVIDTLDNFKTKLSQIPSSAIVLIKDVGQIYAHGTYFGAQKTYSLLTKTADGLAPKGGTSASSQIEDGESEWVLTVTNGENPSWRRLPANAFNSSSYTLSSATTSDLGGIKVGQVYTATFDDLVGQYYKVNIDKNGLAYVHVPWINNPYTASGSGITLKDNVFSLSLNSVTKLDQAIGNKIYAVGLDKNGKLCVSVPWVDTNNIFVGATETKNGSSGMVPAPIANQHRYFLRGDGTWVKPNLSDLNDDVVNGKYLPLTGGTISGSLVIQASSPGVTFKKSNEQNPFASLGIYSNKLSMYVNSENKYYDILHSGNYSSYALSLKGGTLDGTLTVNSDLGVGGLIVNRGHYLFARDNANADWIVTNKNWQDEYKLWHSGNDGSGSGLDADLLDGYHVTHFMSYIKGSGYVQANLLNSELWNVAGGDGYIEYYDNGTWFNSRWGQVQAISGFHRVGSSDSYVLLGGGGHKALSDFAMASTYVKKAGDTMTGPLTISTANWGNQLVLNRVNNGENWGPSIIFKFDGTHNGSLTMQSNQLYIGDNGVTRYKAWHEGNDGSGSGLDADLLDGKHATDFQLAGNYLIDHGMSTSRPNGGTFTLPVGANGVSMRSKATSGADIGIFQLTDDNAFICNSSDNSYLFATFDTDKTTDFSSPSNAAFAVLSDHVGAYMKGSLTVDNNIVIGGSYIFTPTAGSMIGTRYSATDTTLYNRIKINAGTGGIQYNSGTWTSGVHAAHQFLTGGSSSEELVRMVIMNTTGYVGIGTSSPIQPLTVNGQERIIASANASSITLDTCALIIGPNTSGHSGYSTGIGFNSLSYGAYINHIHAWIGLGPYTTTSTAECYPLIFATNGSTTTNTAPVERMRITPDGNIGIGDSNPAYKLEVAGSICGTVMYANRDGSTTAGGVSLYSNSDPMTYGIAFRGTGTYGTHGYVTAANDWATYLTMSDTTNRGWIFRRGATNVASIAGSGNMAIGQNLKFSNEAHISTNRSTDYHYGYTFNLTDNEHSIGMYSGPIGEAGGVVISPDGCLIYNSSDCGYNLQVRDKDLGSDLTNIATLTFGIEQTGYYAWSRGGFKKNGSSDSYVLLGGGGHKAESSLSVNYANSAGNADTVDSYHISVTTSAGTNTSTIYFVT